MIEFQTLLRDRPAGRSDAFAPGPRSVTDPVSPHPAATGVCAFGDNSPARREPTRSETRHPALRAGCTRSWGCASPTKRTTPAGLPHTGAPIRRLLVPSVRQPLFRSSARHTLLRFNRAPLCPLPLVFGTHSSVSEILTMVIVSRLLAPPILVWILVPVPTCTSPSSDSVAVAFLERRLVNLSVLW